MIFLAEANAVSGMAAKIPDGTGRFFGAVPHLLQRSFKGLHIFFGKQIGRASLVFDRNKFVFFDAYYGPVSVRGSEQNPADFSAAAWYRAKTADDGLLQ